MAGALTIAFGVGCIWISGFIAGWMRQHAVNVDRTRKEGARAFMESWPGRTEV